MEVPDAPKKCEVPPDVLEKLKQAMIKGVHDGYKCILYTEHKIKYNSETDLAKYLIDIGWKPEISIQQIINSLNHLARTSFNDNLEKYAHLFVDSDSDDDDYTYLDLEVKARKQI